MALAASPDAGRGEFDCATCLRANGAVVERIDREQLRGADLSGFDRLVVAGGDGSIGRAALAAAGAGVPIAVVPLGTANNFAHAIGLPAEPAAACRLAATSERTRTLELGWAGDIPFVNLASAGLAPVAARRARPWKRLLGPASYTFGAASAALRTPPLRCEVRAARERHDAADQDGTVFAGEAWQVMVAVSGAFGAGIRVEPVSPADGKLDLFVVEAGPRARLAAHAWGMRSGRLRPQAGVRHQRAAVFDLSVPEGTELNLDGEVVPIGRTRFSVDPTGVELVVP